jgi:hypothetical protein
MEWWCGGGASGRPQPVTLTRRPAPVIAARCARAAGGLRDRQDPPGHHDPACTLRPRRDRAVIAVSADIAGIVLPGPVWAARTVAKVVVHPVTVVTAGRIRFRRDLRAGCDRRDHSRCHARTLGTGPPLAP